MGEAIEQHRTGERVRTTTSGPTAAAYVVEASEATLVVTDGHLRVQHTGSQRVRELSAADVRRIQVDVEVGRPATVAIVPNSGAEAELLTVQRDQFRALFAAIQHLAIELDNVNRG
jgi:hypothetical protein